MCALFPKAMHGAQDASAAWQQDCTDQLTVGGFTRGHSSASVFRHDAEDIRVLVHGGDFFRLAGEAGQE